MGDEKVVKVKAAKPKVSKPKSAKGASIRIPISQETQDSINLAVEKFGKKYGLKKPKATALVAAAIAAGGAHTSAVDLFAQSLKEDLDALK